MTSLPAAVLWDLDGTLIDSENYWLQSEQELANAYGANWSHEDGMGMVGLSLQESTKIMQSHMGIQDRSSDEIIQWLTDRVLHQLRKEIPWRPGAKELLLELRKAGVKTALVTMSFRRLALEVVEAIGFEAFDLVVAGDDVERGKPHPEPYLKAAALLGVSAGDCVAIEDSLNGLASAEAAGTMALGVQHIMHLPPAPTRTVIQTLVGVSPEALLPLFK
ncbi:MAG: HAD family hydrolase [Micrococcales bacterium]